MKKLLILLGLIPTLLLGQTTPTERQVLSSGTAITRLPSASTTTVLATDSTVVFTGGAWKKISTTNMASSFPVGITNSVTAISSGTVGSILTHGSGDVFMEYNSKLFWDRTNSFLGLGTSSPLSSFDMITSFSTTATFSSGIRNSTGNYIWGSDNAGHFGINLNGGSTSHGCISDAALEVYAASNTDGDYTAAFKNYNGSFVSLRLSNHNTAGAPDVELGGDIWNNGVTGFGVRANTDYRIYSKGTGNSSATYNFVSVNSDATNLFHIRNDGRVEVHKWLITNPFGTNALSPTLTGQVAFNCNTNVPQANIADAGGSFNIVCLAASAVNVGPNLTGYANYDSGLYPMGDISFRRENGAAGNSAGYMQFSTHTTATGGLTEFMRITSVGGIAFAGATNYGSTGQILTSNGNAPPTWNTEGQLLHSISTPTVGATVTLTNNYINIISPAGTLASLTINFPNSPSNNDFVEVTFDQIITSVTYVAGTGGATIKGQINGVVGGQKRWDYDTGTNTWY